MKKHYIRECETYEYSIAPAKSGLYVGQQQTFVSPTRAATVSPTTAQFGRISKRFFEDIKED